MFSSSEESFEEQHFEHFTTRAELPKDIENTIEFLQFYEILPFGPDIKLAKERTRFKKNEHYVLKQKQHFGGLKTISVTPKMLKGSNLNLKQALEIFYDFCLDVTFSSKLSL